MRTDRPQALPRGSAAATTINHLDGQIRESGFPQRTSSVRNGQTFFCAATSCSPAAKFRLSLKHQGQEKVSVAHLELYARDKAPAR
jgi:hypothetical protein